MRKVGTLLLLVILAVVAGLAAEEHAPLKRIATIPLPTLKQGDFDHFAVDLEHHRLFVTTEKNGVVPVFDTNSNKVIHTIEGLDEAHSLLLRGDLKRLFIVDGGASELKVFDSDTYKQVGTVKLTEDADSMAYDPATKYMYIVNGGRESKTPYSFISVVDTNASKKVRDIKIDSDHLEAVLLEKSGPRLFINITGQDTVGVMDRKGTALSARWKLPAGDTQNVAMAFDEAGHRLFLSTRKPAKLVVLNSDTGAVVASVPSVELIDDMAYDAKHKRIYLAGSEFVDVIEQKDADHYERLAKIPGRFRAKTALLVPELNRYYLAVPNHGAEDAAVWVFEVMP